MKRIWNWIKRWQWIIYAVLTLLGVVFAIIGYDSINQKETTATNIYEAIRLIIVSHQFEDTNSWTCCQRWFMEIARWILLIVFFFVARKAIITVFFKEFRKLRIKIEYKSHIIIIGDSDIAKGLVHKYVKAKHKQIVYICQENSNEIQLSKVENLIGDATNLDVLQDANILKASTVFVCTDQDSKNIEIAQKIWAYLTKNKNPSADCNHGKFNKKKYRKYHGKPELKCYTLVQDIELKNDVENSPNIFLFSCQSETLNSIFNPIPDTETDSEVFRFRTRNIAILDPLQCFIDFIINKNEQIEKMATHLHENIYHDSTKYKSLTEHYKQSNRNNVLDNYIKTYIATGKMFEAFIDKKEVLPSDVENNLTINRDTLAKMEHRRWMIEKYYDGWSYDIITEKKANGKEKTKDDAFKRHECLLAWDKLDKKEKLLTTKEYDYKAIDFMIATIKNLKK